MDPQGRPEALLSWLENRGATAQKARQTLRRYPNLAGYSIERKLDPAVHFVREALQLDPAAVTKFIVGVPDLLCRSQTSLQSIFASFIDAGLTQEQLQVLCSRFPTVLRAPLSSADSRRKLQFLSEELHLDVVKTLLRCPAFLTYSLPRILVRCRYAEKEATLGGRSLQGSLSVILSYSEEKFVEYMSTSLEEYRAWRQAWMQSDEARRWLKDTLHDKDRGVLG